MSYGFLFLLFLLDVIHGLLCSMYTVLFFSFFACPLFIQKPIPCSSNVQQRCMLCLYALYFLSGELCQ